MPTILPLTISTVLIQFAAGVAFMLVWRSLRLGMPLLPAKSTSGKVSEKSKKSSKKSEKIGTPPEVAPHDALAKSWLWVAAAAALALIATMFQELPPHTAGITPSEPLWLRLPSLLIVLTAALAFLTWQKHGQVSIGLLATVSGWAAVVAQALMFTPTSLGSLSGLLPLTMFALGALAFGAAHVQLLEYRASTAVSHVETVAPDGADTSASPAPRKASSVAVATMRAALWPLLLVVALVPSVGAGGDPIMRQVALMWMETLPYWAGVMATGVALGVSYMGPGTSIIQWGLVAVSLLCTRFAFFSDGIHFSAPLFF